MEEEAFNLRQKSEIDLQNDLQFAIEQIDCSSLDQESICDIENLAQAFKSFGYNSDDIIDKRDQIVMFRKIRAEMVDMLREMTAEGKYVRASDLRDRLSLIQKEFLDLQHIYEVNRQAKESGQFTNATSLVWLNKEKVWKESDKIVEASCNAKLEDLAKTHKIQTQQLEAFLEKKPEPRVKFSKTLLDLKNTETSLTKLKLYEDAKNVFSRSDSLEKLERANNKAAFETYKAKRRAYLLSVQQEELRALEEKLTEATLSNTRSNARKQSTNVQRIKNLQNDMNHAFCLDRNKPAEFTTDPVIKTRKGHSATSSSYRGQQLLSTVRGKRLEVASLCALHDDENGNVPSGSVVY